MGCLDDDLPCDSDPQKMINAVHDMFELFYELEIKPSLWRLYDTKNLKKLFRALDVINEIASRHIDIAQTRFLTSPKAPDERSVLESLLSIDEQTAYIMAVDMLTAGIDTVCTMSIKVNASLKNGCLTVAYFRQVIPPVHYCITSP